MRETDGRVGPLGLKRVGSEGTQLALGGGGVRVSDGWDLGWTGTSRTGTEGGKKGQCEMY